MTITSRKGDVRKESCDMLVLHCFQDAKELTALTKIVDDELKGFLSTILKEEKFKGRLGQSILIRLNNQMPVKRVLIVGLGKKDELNLETVRRAAATFYQAVKEMEPTHVIFGLIDAELNPKEVGKAMTEGIRLAAYSFTRYRKNGNNHKQPEQFELMTEDGRAARLINDGIALGEISSAGTIVARDLVNTPAGHMRPIDLVTAAESAAKGKGSIRIRVYDREGLEKLGAGGILGVSQGSDYPPYLVHLVYKPKKPTKKKIAIVGKAVTFDSGGLSLKPADAMMTMKCDMSGSAAVIGLFSVIDQIDPHAEVHGIFGAVENMPSSKAYRPGDVLTAMNGKTMEVLNTDAEGRLTLADTLSFAVKQKPDMILDLATLTGACLVALGEEITGVMSNDSKLANRVLTAAALAGEKMWELPLEKNYKCLIKSDVADVKNIGNKWGGALTAGLFLEEFVDNVPWAHLDIAGPAFAERDIDEYTKKGATGHGVRTLIEFLRGL